MNRRAPAPAFSPEVRRSVSLRPLLTAAVAGGCLLLLVAYALSLKPVWLAESQVYVEPAAAKLLGDQGSTYFDSVKYESYLQQQIQTATRNDILEAAIATLPAGTWQQPGEPLSVAADRLASQLAIRRVTTSYQLAIQLKDNDPVKAAAIVNAVTQAYLKAGRKDELTQTDQRVQLLDEERVRIDRELAQARTEQAALSVSLGVANAAGQDANPYDAQLVGLRAELAGARQAHAIAGAQLAAYAGQGATRTAGRDAAADELINGDAGLSSLKSNINARRAQLEGQMAGLTPSNPVYKQDQNEIADLDRALETSTAALRERAARRLEDRLKTDLERTGDIEGRLNAQLGKQTAAATGAAPKLQRATELAADIQRLMARYAAVDDSLRTLQLDANGPGMVHLALPATVPSSPEPSRRRLLLLAALPLALLCGIAAAVFAHKRDPRLYLPSEMDKVLGFSPLAVLPQPAEVSTAVMREYMLRLAGGVESAYRAAGARTFLFTALSPETRLDDLLRDLGRCLGELGLRLATVDAASLLRPVTPGAGTPAPAALGLPEGHVVGRLERIRQGQDIVLISASPLLLSAHAEYIARSSDATILVAESGRATKTQLAHAGLLLQRLHVAGIAAVLVGLSLRNADASFRATVRRLESDGIPGQAAISFATPVPLQDKDAATSTTPAPVDAVFAAPEEERVEARPAGPLLERVPPATPHLDEIPRTPAAMNGPRPEPPTEAEPAPARKSWLRKLVPARDTAVYSILPDEPDEIDEEAAEVTAAAPAEVTRQTPTSAPAGSPAEQLAEEFLQPGRAPLEDVAAMPVCSEAPAEDVVADPAAIADVPLAAQNVPVSEVRAAASTIVTSTPQRTLLRPEPAVLTDRACLAVASRAVPEPLRATTRAAAPKVDPSATPAAPEERRPEHPEERLPVADEDGTAQIRNGSRWERIPLLRPGMAWPDVAVSPRADVPVRSDSSSPHRRTASRYNQGQSEGLTRRWGLLSRFEHAAEDDPALTSGRS